MLLALIRGRDLHLETGEESSIVPLPDTGDEQPAPRRLSTEGEPLGLPLRTDQNTDDPALLR